MDLREYLRVLRRRWRAVLALALLGLGVAVFVNATSTRMYRASAEVFVSVRGGNDALATAYQGNLFSQDRVKSYAKIVSSPVVTEPVARQLDLVDRADRLAGSISATVPAGTVLIDIAVRDPSPARARDVANAVSRQFGEVVRRLEAPRANAASPVTVTVVRPAALPTDPVSPRGGLNLALGLLVGLGLGVAFAVLRESLDTTVKNAEDVAALTGSTPIGEIAHDPSTPSRPLVTSLDPRSVRAEAFRSLRTNLQFVDVDHPPRVVVVTSSVMGEGKSTTACNLAITLAGAGTRVVLVEGDLRRPRVADYMGVEGAVGLTDVLVGRSSLNQVLQPWGPMPLSVLPSGPIPPNPSELLGSAQMTDLLAELRDTCDLVLVDAPPLLPVTDAAVLARACDGALVVVRHGKARREQLTRSLESLSNVGARLLGTVLTMAPAGGPLAYGYRQSYYEARTDVPQLLADELVELGEPRR